MNKIYPFFNIFISFAFFFLFVLCIFDILEELSFLSFMCATISLFVAISAPGLYITYDEIAYTYHFYFYKRKIDYKDISVVSLYGFKFGATYILWAKSKSLVLFLPFCRNKTDDFFTAIKKENPSCKFLF